MSLNMTCASTSSWYSSWDIRLGFSPPAKVRGQRVHPPPVPLRELRERGQHPELEPEALLLGHAAGKVEADQVPPHPDPHGQLVLSQLPNVVVGPGGVPVGDVPLGAGGVSVIVANHLVEEATELGVVVDRHGIAAQPAVGVLQAGPDALVEHGEICAISEE